MVRLSMPKPRRALTLILSAMPSEIRLIQGRMESGAKTGTLAVFPYQRGVLNGRLVATAVTGVGVTNAAMVTALFAHYFQPTEIIVSGTGSRFNPRIRTGDTVVSVRTIHHAAGSLTAEGMVYRKVRGPLAGQMTHWQYPPDARLLRLAKASIPGYEAVPVTANGEMYRPTVLAGIVAASDLFGVSDEKIADLRAKLDPDIMEMESAAIAQVCSPVRHPAHRLPRGQQPDAIQPGLGLPQARARPPRTPRRAGPCTSSGCLAAQAKEGARRQGMKLFSLRRRRGLRGSLRQ